jgi:hypothetical protein
MLVRNLRVVVLELDVDDVIIFRHKQTTPNLGSVWRFICCWNYPHRWNLKLLIKSYCRIWRRYRCFHSYSSPWKRRCKKLKKGESADFKVTNSTKNLKELLLLTLQSLTPWRRRENVKAVMKQFFSFKPTNAPAHFEIAMMYWQCIES